MVHAASEPVDIVLAHWPSELREAWVELETRGSCLPFQRYAWVNLWCELLAAHQRVRPCIVQVSRAGIPVCILPLSLRQHQEERVVEFLGTEYNDYNAPVLAPGASLDALLLEHVLTCLPPYDRIDLCKLLIGVEADGLLSSPYTSVDEAVGHQVSLTREQTWSSTAVREVARKRRKLSREACHLELVDATNESPVFDLLLRWKREQYPDYLQDEPSEAFYRGMLQTDVARLYALRIDGAISAASFVVVTGSTCTSLITSYDKKWHDTSPGKLVLVSIMERMRDEGFTLFDSGGGREAYKQDFAPGWETLYRYRR